MFNKVLISDDLGSISSGVIMVVNTLGIQNTMQVQYCDDAYIQIKKAILNDSPFDLLITDLSFKSDYRDQKYHSGEVLIKTLKQEYPDLKIIAYSVEDRLQKVRTIIQDCKANAYVCKGRKGLFELTEAISQVYKNQLYLSPQVENALYSKIDIEINDYDIELVKLLSNGLSQDKISEALRKNNINPSSVSSIEKRLTKLRIHFKANNAIHLVAIVKDLGLI
jgi:DNA-binding NarL/FixJ family response regulator